MPDYPEFPKYNGPHKLPDAEMARRAEIKLQRIRDKKTKAREDRGTPQIGRGSGTDLKLLWVLREYPDLEEWRNLALSWLQTEVMGIPDRLRAIKVFFTKYLATQQVPLKPEVFLSRKTKLPPFFETTCSDSKAGAILNNLVHDFLESVLYTHFLVEDEAGHPKLSPKYHNPFCIVSLKEYWKPNESVYSTLPYGFIEEIKNQLAQGPNFKDWIFAQTAMGAAEGTVGLYGPDWFPVDEVKLDRTDPDCVWRIRSRVHSLGGPRLEMWSPVRWVALLLKLLLPLRTAQVRLLDSGEADTWRYTNRGWSLSTSKLREGTESKPLQQGVFRRVTSLSDSTSAKTVLYINTNKTADIWKNGPDKGYVIHWEHKEVLFWLEKLRNWQEKYNPIMRRTSWAELDSRYRKTMSREQLASYPDACFLFRMPEAKHNNKTFPLVETALSRPWYKLLKQIETNINARGGKHANGAPIRLVYEEDESNSGSKVYFPLHSLRVSLVTALAFDGKVPFPILQKVVGHSRLLMTLYYAKPSESVIQTAMSEGMKRLEENKEQSIIDFLMSEEHSSLLDQAICNSSVSLTAVVPAEKRSRNPAGWMAMHHGVCLVGGNTSAIEGNSSLGGCHNGGPNTGTDLVPEYGPVPGGTRNCIRCRWFITEAHYLPALVAHFNNLAYHFEETRIPCVKAENTLQELKIEKADCESQGRLFTKQNELSQTQRIFETKMTQFSDLVEDLTACNAFIERCRIVINNPSTISKQLIAQGQLGDLQVVFEQTESELLQLSGVCENTEIYPDLDPGKAVYRRSQILDRFLHAQRNEPIFMQLTEPEQLLCGNAYMRNLATQINPQNPVLGLRQVALKIEAGQPLDPKVNVSYSDFVPDQYRKLTLESAHE